MVKQLKMKMLALLIFSFLLSCKSVSSFVNSNRAKVVPKSALFGVEGNNSSPLLVRAALGQSVERVPVWMMRQAGRHMKAYRDLCKVHDTFRKRSENVQVATEISLQPWRAYGTDACILFSDILTPLPGMGIEFEISDKGGPQIKPITKMSDVDAMTSLNPKKSLPFIAEIFRNLRGEVGSSAAVLGFIGMPFTVASYMIEGRGTQEFRTTKQMAYTNPEILHALLKRLADNLAEYAIYQIESGAQAIQVFDSWAGNLSPVDYELFAAQYQRMVISKVKQAYPNIPIIIYINKSGALIEKMGSVGADVVSLDWTVSIEEGRRRLKNKVGIQGNLDPMVLFAPKEVITSKTIEILEAGRGARHIMNLGHGIDEHTSEENANHFVQTVKNWIPRK